MEVVTIAPPLSIIKVELSIKHNPAYSNKLEIESDSAGIKKT